MFGKEVQGTVTTQQGTDPHQPPALCVTPSSLLTKETEVLPTVLPEQPLHLGAGSQMQFYFSLNL
jgi:hypothetical protein